MGFADPYRIYVVANKDTGVVKYVGLTKQLGQQRWREHFSAARNGAPGRLYSALRKHGLDAFNFSFVVTCDGPDEAKRVERTLIEEYRTFARGGYNATPGGDGAGKDGRVVGAEESAQISARNLANWSDPEWAARQRERMRGVKKPEGFGAAISERRKGVKLSNETRRRMSEARKGKKHAPEVLAKIAAANRARAEAARQVAL